MDLLKSLEELENLLKISIDFQRRLAQENRFLKEELNIKTKKIVDLELKINELETENKKIKIVSVLSGSSEYKKIMKLKINKLIKEVDICVDSLKNN